MKGLIPALAILATLAAGCGAPKQPDSTLNAASSSPSVSGETKIRVVTQHDYISIQLKGEELFAALWNYLKIDATMEGEDGAYYVYKTTDELTCGGDNYSSEGELENFEDPSCTINLSRDGKAGVVNDDPWAWAQAPIKSEDISTTVTFKDGKAYVMIHPDSDTHLLWEALTGLEAKDDLDEEIQHKQGKDIRVDYEYADGDDFVGLFTISKKGLLTAE